MRLAVFASVLTAGIMWLALGGAPAQSQKEAAQKSSCSTCGQAKACPHCAGKGHGAGHAHRYEYKCVHQSVRASNKAAEVMTAQFSGLGGEGWRLAKADNGFWCFVRLQGK